VFLQSDEDGGPPARHKTRVLSSKKLREKTPRFSVSPAPIGVAAYTLQQAVTNTFLRLKFVFDSHTHTHENDVTKSGPARWTKRKKTLIEFVKQVRVGKSGRKIVAETVCVP